MQLQKVSGVVVDQQGEPVIGATVVLKSDRSIGTAQRATKLRCFRTITVRIAERI